MWIKKQGITGGAHMARPKISDKKEQTVEERLLAERKRELSNIERKLQFFNEPTYFFSVGEEVTYGALKKSVVDEIFYDGKAYGLICDAVDNNYGHPIEYKTYRVAAWHEVRPCNNKSTSFAKNQDVMISFNNTTIEGLLYRKYFSGVDFNPEYQRGYVWELKDKEMLIDSIFNNIDIGKFVFIKLNDDEWMNRGVSYEILDGKQRLSTLVEFYENRFSYKGKYYNDLSQSDKSVFKNHFVSEASVDDIDKKTVLKYFLMLNRTGRVMDEGHLEEIEKMLADCR